MLLLGFLLLAGAAIFAEGKSYQGHHLLSVKATTEEQIQVLQRLEDNYDLVFLRGPSSIVSTDFVVPPDQMEKTMSALENADITITVQSTNMQAEIDAERRQSLSHERRTNNGVDLFDYSFYRRLNEVEQYLRTLSNKYPDLVRLETLKHKTFEGREVYGLKIGKQDETKPVIMIEVLAHAREWATTASILYVMNEMLSGYKSGQDKHINEALDLFNWYIIPVVNPDGYTFTWENNRLWRKNMRRNPKESCYGVDLNRNFDSKWNEIGTSPWCNGDTYAGDGPFSEPETQNIRDKFYELNNVSTVVSFLSVHAYSQILLLPWGHSDYNTADDLPPNFVNLTETAYQMVQAMKSVDGKKYVFGTPHATIGYAASGGSFDWALKVKPDILSYCYELRPGKNQGFGGFLLPSDQIIPTGEELLMSLFVLVDSLK